MKKYILRKSTSNEILLTTDDILEIEKLVTEEPDNPNVLKYLTYKCEYLEKYPKSKVDMLIYSIDYILELS